MNCTLRILPSGTNSKRLLAALVLLASVGCLRAADPLDFLIQKVCVDDGDHLLSADPYNPPKGSHLRNLRVGEALPYYKHDQPSPGEAYGFQRHDSYPVHLRSGEVAVLNPFDFGENHTGNGYDIYLIRDGWASASETRDGGGFSTTFFGSKDGKIVPWGGWVLFPTSFVAEGFKAGSAKIPIEGRYWEHDGERWPGKTPNSLFPNSETSWKLIKGCRFGGINENPVKSIDAIQSVHGYVSKPDPVYESNMMKGHLEVFYFTPIYGITRWEVWTSERQIGDLNKPSEARDQSLRAARYAQPLTEVGQRYYQPTDLPQTPQNRGIALDYVGEDGEKNTYVISDVRDWSAVTILPSPEPPPVWPLPSQNLLKNFHFDGGDLVPWKSLGSDGKEIAVKGDLLKSRAPRDVQYEQDAPDGGVRYLALHSASDANIHQDVPIAEVKDGSFIIAAKVRSAQAGGTVRLALQQMDGKGAVLSTEIDVSKPLAATNMEAGYKGVDDTDPKASVFLASKYVTGRARLTLRPNAAFLRFSLSSPESNTMDIVDTNLSQESP